TTNSGTLDLNSYSVSVGAMFGTSGVITDASATSGTATLTDNQSSTTSYGGTIVDGATAQVGLIKSGTPRKLTLTGPSNPSNGGTTVNGGILQTASSANSPADFTKITVNTTGVFAGNVGGAGEWDSNSMDVLLSVSGSAGAVFNGGNIGFDTTDGNF